MTILRPVTQRAPATSKVLEDTSLPFSFVITPFGQRAELAPPSSSTPSRQKDNATTARGADTADTSTSSPPQPPLPVPAALVAKCTHCGSPSNPCSPCIDSISQLYLCGLCGNTYGADGASQHAARRRADWSSWSTDNANADLNWKEAYQQRRRSAISTERRGVMESSRRGSDDEVGMDSATRRHVYELSLPVVPTSNDDIDLMIPQSDGAQYPSPYAIPARLCPPILLFLVDGTSYNQSYYDAVCRSLYKAIETAPDYARVGIFLATEHGGMSVFDLGGSVPHLKHCRVPIRCDSTTNRGLFGRGSSAGGSGTLVHVAELHDAIVPLSSYYKSHVEAAIRALGDMTTVIGGACRHQGGGGGGGRTSSRSGMSEKEGIHLGASIEALLDYLVDGTAFHPDLLDRDATGGRSSADKMENWSVNTGGGDLDEDDSFFRYAGGKVMCFLSGAPMEIDSNASTNNSSSATGTIGTGGFGGSCAEVGRRYAAEDDLYKDEGASGSTTREQVGDDDFDPEAGGMRRDNEGLNGNPAPAAFGRNVRKSSGLRDADLYFNGLGIRCAESALGVELFILGTYESESASRKPYVGLPLLRCLSDRSGACGPLLVGIGDYDDYSSDMDGANGWGNATGGTVGALLREVLARCPWGRPVAFGTMLRLRMTPSLSIDYSPVEQLTKHHYEGEEIFIDPRLATLHKNNGFFGPIAPSAENDLVVAGTFDTTSTLMFDVDIVSKAGKANERIYLEGRGEVEVPPCIQSCFAYTSIVRWGDEWITVRRLRVLSTNMKVSNDTEGILASLDAEALAVALYHKLVLSSMQDGLEEAQHVAQDWLLSTLLCAYRSAEAYYERMKVEDEHGVSRSRIFCPSERLMGHGGSDLTDRDVLLAQGHDRLSSLPLLVFSLLQCDALRPSGESFRPTVDARVAAAANMASMSPGSLARCIAPRLEIWLERDNDEEREEPLVESLNMNMEALRLAFADLRDDAQVTNQAAKHSPILLLDSPRQVMLCYCGDIVELIDGKRGKAAANNARTSDSMGPMLQRATKETLDSYRVPPPVLYCLEDSNTGCLNEAVLHLQDALVEDSFTSLSKENFERWCTEVASLLHSEVTSSKDDA